MDELTDRYLPYSHEDGATLKRNVTTPRLYVYVVATVQTTDGSY